MTLQTSADLEAIRRSALTRIQAHWKLLLLEGILLLILGMVAIAVPYVSTLEAELFVGWLFVVGGLLRAIAVLRKRHLPGFTWSLLSAVLAVVLGAALIARPLQGVITLTIVMTVLFVIEGVAAILIALEYRRYLRSWPWTLLSGLITLALAYLIWQGWPNTARWVIGLYVGISLVFLGLPLITTALAARTVGSGRVTT
jgi:uncharacterized membrane protein HdeD (DUF308 family)